MKICKMHGLGNDFVLVNGFEVSLPENLADFALDICDRHLGIGADGLIIILPSQKADLHFVIYNSDGSEAEMCGNGMRCAAIFSKKEGLCSKDIIHFETKAGDVLAEIVDEEIPLVRVNMGKARFVPHNIPAGFPGDRVVNYPLEIGDKIYYITLVSMGNPHCVIFVEDVDTCSVRRIGSAIENYHLFPAKTNVEFVQVINDHKLRMRVWERGCGETLACGTGACAVAMAAILNDHCPDDGQSIEVELSCGSLLINRLEDFFVEMTGPATTVFYGEYLYQPKNLY